MLRDTWWWPWWVSSLIDLVSVLTALVVFLTSRRRTLRGIAAAVAVLATIAAVLAPVVMTEESERPMQDGPAMSKALMNTDRTPPVRGRSDEKAISRTASRR